MRVRSGLATLRRHCGVFSCSRYFGCVRRLAKRLSATTLCRVVCSQFYRMQGNETAVPFPHIGIETEDIRHKRCTFRAWDVSSQAVSRRMWSSAFPDTEALVFVVDSSDRERLEEAAEELRTALAHEDMRGCRSVLVYANKQDCDGCLSVAEVTSGLGLPRVAAGRKWTVQSCIATRSSGVMDGLDWLEASLMGDA